MLPQRKLGNQGLTVSALGLGCMGMSQSYGEPNDPESIKTLHHAIDLGVNFFDTAEMYGPYTNEALLGKAFKGLRDKVIIATKFGFNIQDGKIAGVTSKPAHIIKAVEGSLKRLNTDYIDLLYQHRVDRDVPIEEVIGTMVRLIQEGKVKYLGLSEASLTTIKKAHAIHPITALQSEYSIWERELEKDFLPLLRELKIGLVPFSPLGRGFLTGHAMRAEAYPENDYRRIDPRYQGKNFDANMNAVSIIKRLATDKNATPSQIALAWLLQKGEDIVPIPGTKKINYLEENLGAITLKLSPADMKVLDDALPPGKTSGPRYAEKQMAYIDR